jgi:hypothetical protein
MPRRPLGACALVALAAWVAVPAPARAQLDPLLFAKRIPPNVIVVVDTSLDMLEDGEGSYYDPHTYPSAGDPVAAHLGVGTATYYRRIYRSFEVAHVTGSEFEAETIVAVPSNAPAYGKFWSATRLEIMRTGLLAAVTENGGTAAEETADRAPRWGLIRLRQSGAAWPTACDKPVDITADAALAALGDATACTGATGTFGVWVPTVSSPNYSHTGAAPVGTVIADPADATQRHHQYLTARLATPTPWNSQLIPAGRDQRTFDDRPVRLALLDALDRAQAAVLADTTCPTCRNTVVVLLTSGGNSGDAAYEALGTATDAARAFASVSVGGAARRMPIYVVGVKPDKDDLGELQAIADESGGRYFDAASAADVTRAVNLAVQAAYGNTATFNLSKATEHVPVSPIVGTVNLEGARDADGTLLPLTEIVSVSGAPIPQRSNMIITAGFSLGGPDAGADGGPGFDGRIRAFRTFKPVADGARVTGYKFVKDGTRLWPSLDGRPEVAGMARTPADSDARNLYTYVPGRGLIPFTLDEAETLRPHLGGADPAQLIPFVRRLPLGAVIGSTPALMDPPSLDPPPDTDYGWVDTDGSYANRLKSRRAILWFGANDGMIHGVDARTGYEVWAFVPFNLLPKLKTLRDGQPVHQFEYFVDSSPKIAEVKLAGKWTSMLIIGQGAGGTHYQAFDVTRAGMDGPAPDSDDYEGVLGTFRDDERVELLWAFPDYESFDTSLTGTGTAVPLNVSDATPGGRVRLYGDVRLDASAVAKSVGFTWSDPAVGPLDKDRKFNVMIVGSGYFPDVEATLTNRMGDSPPVRAGRSFYLVDLETGKVVGDPTKCSGTGCYDVGDLASPTWKNALQADPTAAGTPGSYLVTKAYLGDLDGRYWRFTFDESATIAATALVSTGQPIYNSSALLMVGTAEQYVFFSTGSDLLPRVASAGGDEPGYKLMFVRDQNPTATVTFTKTLGWPGGSGKNRTYVMERPSSAPSVAGDIVFFTTTLEDTLAPCASGAVQSQLYAFGYRGGPAYDTDGSGTMDTKKDTPEVKKVSGRATAPFIVDQHLYFGTSGPDGPVLEVFGNPEDFNNGVGQVGVRILSWRELR